MNSTKNLNLKKPESTDFYNIDEFNGNMDIVDEEITKLNEKIVNHNLLINSNFANPVNQRGKNKYNVDEDTVYTIDRWEASGCDVSVEDGFVRIHPNTGALTTGLFRQHISIPIAELKGKSLAISYETADETCAYIVQLPSTISASYKSKEYSFGVGNKSYLSYHSAGCISLVFYIAAQLNLKWAKVEIGNKATPYVAKMFDEEFLLCQRYFQKRNVKDAKLVRVGTDYLRFVFSIFPRMRITPTEASGFSNVDTLYNNSSTSLNFQFNAPNYDEGMMEITAVNYDESGNRIAHGWTISDCPSLNGEVYLDAEI